MYCELVSVFAVVSDPVTMFADTREGQDVCDAVWVIPDCTVSIQVADLVRGSYTSVTMDLHRPFGCTYVREQVVITENVHSRLVIEKYPRSGEPSVLPDLARDSFTSVLKELKMSFSIEFSVCDTRHQQCCPGLRSSSLGNKVWTFAGIMSFFGASVACDVGFPCPGLFPSGSHISCGERNSVGRWWPPSVPVLLFPVC